VRKPAFAVHGGFRTRRRAYPHWGDESMPTKNVTTKSRKGRREPNYLIVGQDGTFLLTSGATGKIRALNPAEVKRVVPLLKERQRLGRQLAEALETTGFALADDGIIDLEV